MSTIVSENKIQPAVNMNKVHVDFFTFKQPRETNPKRSINGSFCLYGEDENGNRVFDTETVGSVDPDMDATIVGNALANGQTLTDFMTEYTVEKNNIDAEYKLGNISDIQLMAYLELIMSRSFELNGKLNIVGIE